MDDEPKLIEIGQDAEILLGSETFTRVTTMLADMAIQAFMNSAPEQRDERERSYHHYRALLEIVSTLKQQVSVKDEILKKQNEE